MDAALYVRVSSDRQDVDLSVSAQLKALRRYANEHEYRVVKEYVDEAETGRTSDRSGFREMIFGARQDPKPFDVILVWKYARFARNRQDSIVHKAMLRKKGIQVISVTEPIDDTPTGRLLEGIIESLDEFYSDNLGEEVTRGMRESASRGYYLSSRAPYGYKKVRVRDGDRERTRLEINEYQSRVVVSIFDMVQEGKGLCEITKELNSKGIAGPTGKGWGKTTLHTILTNEVYEGTLIWGRNSKRGLQPIIAENACPAIVDKEIFNTVQQRLKDRAPARIHPRRVASRYLLSGIAHCGHSGKALIGQEAKSGQFSYYVCGTLNKKGSGSCRAKYLNANEFERLIVNRIKQHILTPDPTDRTGQ